MNTLEKEFVPYQPSLDMKELGFDEPCFGVYYTKDGHVRIITENEKGDAPTFSQCFKWFREKYRIDSWVEEVNHGINNGNKRYIFQIPTSTSHLDKITFFDTYEEAELACLRKLIEIVKKK